MPDIVTDAILVYVVITYAAASYMSYQVWKEGGYSRTWGLILLSDAIVPMSFWAVVIADSLLFPQAPVVSGGSEMVINALFLVMTTMLVVGLYYLWKVVKALGTGR